MFISNEILGVEKRTQLRIPMTFISFGIIEGKMYRHFRNRGTFIVKDEGNWGNRVVYGGIFAISEFNFYISLLDAYHQCSMSTFRFNHNKDVHHRSIEEVTPIHFNSIDELERLQYRENSPINAHVYLGNKNHPKIKQRFNKKTSYRIIDGVDEHFIELYREVKNGQE